MFRLDFPHFSDFFFRVWRLVPEVITVGIGSKETCCLTASGISPFYFITYTPLEDTGMITASPHYVFQIPFSPFLEMLTITMSRIVFYRFLHIEPFIFGIIPLIEELFLDQKTYLIAQRQKLIRSRIVRKADGVTSSFLKGFQTSVPHIAYHCCANYTGIMMQAYSFYLHIFSVKEETFVCIKVECSYTEPDSVFRNDFIAILNTGLGCIEDWYLDAPQIRLFYLRYDVDNFLLTSIQFYTEDLKGCDIAFIIFIHYLNNSCSGFRVTVAHGNLVVYFSIFISNHGSSDKCSPNRNMQSVGYNHFHIPVYT